MQSSQAENAINNPTEDNKDEEVSENEANNTDDDGLIVIASSHAGEYGAEEPEHHYKKMRIKYTNGSFSVPEIIEEYDEYRELVK